jgi:glycosyltransferase involved in cell wall biosynthesis
MPRVTVGMPTYRRADHLRHAVQQVLAQTYADFELIICDDASPDETPEVARSFTDPRVRYERNPSNLNIPRILNKLLELARGDLILILHDHDSFHPRLLERMVEAYDRNPELGFVHPGVAWVDPSGGNYREFLAEYPPIMSGRDLAGQILFAPSFSSPITACSMVSRAAYEKAGMHYDERFGFLSDTDLWLRLCLDHDVGYLREPLLICRERDSGHRYAGISWQMMQWAADIAAVNIERHFADDPAVLGRAREHWRRTRDRAFRHGLLMSAAHGDLGAFREGLGHLGRSPGWSGRVARALDGRHAVHEILVSVGARLNRARGRLRKAS